MAKQKINAQSDANLLYLLTYVLLWLTGILVYITEGQKDKRAKFHALQAIFLGVVVTILGYIPIIRILALVLWIYGIYIGIRAYQGTDISIPVLGDYAKKYS